MLFGLFFSMSLLFWFGCYWTHPNNLLYRLLFWSSVLLIWLERFTTFMEMAARSR